MTQDELARAMNVKDRQTIAAIEAGERNVSAAELAMAARALRCKVDDFVDPYRLIGEGTCNFRTAPDVASDALDEFEARARCLVATFRELGRQEAIAPTLMGMKLELSAQPSFEEVQRCAESLWSTWELGSVPAKRLESAILGHLGVLVLHVDAPKGVSGAAVHLPGNHSILVNRAESAGRRSFDMAHELFHVLTWDALRPGRVDPVVPKKTKGSRTEQLAENFAAALLMPSPVVAERWSTRGLESVATWAKKTAQHLSVSAAALLWRLVNLKLLPMSEVEDVAERVSRLAKIDERSEEVPRLFSEEFVARVHRAVEDGRLSLRRAASLLGTSLPQFAHVCGSYGLDLSYQVLG
jgi:Zn-dependent peptidase ImmA (M78 family)/transcriptional regulator with XRE-family HTH domain